MAALLAALGADPPPDRPIQTLRRNDMSRIKIALFAAATVLLITACASSQTSSAPPAHDGSCRCRPGYQCARVSHERRPPAALSGTWSGHLQWRLPGHFHPPLAAVRVAA